MFFTMRDHALRSDVVAISRSQRVSRSPHVVVPAKKNFHESALSGNGQESSEEDWIPGNLMRQFALILIVIAVAIVQTYAGSLDWTFNAAINDDAARKEAQFFVWDGVSHSFSARFEKVDIVDKDGPFYLFHVVLTSPGAGAERDRSSYLVCFKLTEDRTDFRILTAIQYASDPPTEDEIRIDKRLNRWPVSPPWKAEDDLPRHIKPPGLSIVLDKCRAASDQ